MSVSTAALALSVLQKTRERLQNPNDWSKGKAKNDAGSVCLVWALCEQMDDTDFSVAKVGAAAQALRNVMPAGNSDGLARYNDKPGVTQEDILELLDNAIKECDRLLDPV